MEAILSINDSEVKFSVDSSGASSLDKNLKNNCNKPENQQKRGVAHLHVLIDKYIPQSWISRTWQALGGGKICDIRAIDIHRVSGYVSKYLTKDLIGDGLGSYRRYSTSRGIKLLEKRERTEEDDDIYGPSLNYP